MSNIKGGSKVIQKEKAPQQTFKNSFNDTPEARILVIGVGGGGGNAIDTAISMGVKGVDFVAMNTDSQALKRSLAEKKIVLGVETTGGLGAGSNPHVGRCAAEESIEEIEKILDGYHIVFIVASMGGGTGTGAAPLIAKIAQEKNILTVGVITKPFMFEGQRRMALAEEGLSEIEEYICSLIVIPNQNIFRIANEKTTFQDACQISDNVLCYAIRSITDLITMTGLINLDLADVRAVMSIKGRAMIGVGEGEGEDRAIKAAESVISNPLLDKSSMEGAAGVLINITSADITLYEVDEIVNRIKEEVPNTSLVIFGSVYHSDLKGKICVSVIATGLKSEQSIQNVAQEENRNSMFSFSKNLDNSNQKKNLFSPIEQQNNSSINDSKKKKSYEKNEENFVSNEDSNLDNPFISQKSIKFDQYHNSNSVMKGIENILRQPNSTEEERNIYNQFHKSNGEMKNIDRNEFNPTAQNIDNYLDRDRRMNNTNYTNERMVYQNENDIYNNKSNTNSSFNGNNYNNTLHNNKFDLNRTDNSSHYNNKESIQPNLNYNHHENVNSREETQKIQDNQQDSFLNFNFSKDGRDKDSNSEKKSAGSRFFDRFFEIPTFMRNSKDKK